MGASIYRVVVRGQFADLAEEQRAALLAEVTDHEIFKAAYTEWGTFTYDERLQFFQFRYEVRVDNEAASDGPAPIDVGLARTTTQLDDWGIGHKHLRATATDLSSVWSASPEQ